MLLEAVKQTENIKIVDLKFLEPGHTHMECDSMHASIERVTEHTKIFWPNDWLNVLRLANKKKPYRVNIMTHSDFLDYKGLKDKIMIITKKSEEGENVNWKEIKWLRFQKDTPTSFQYRNEYWKDFKIVNVTRLGRKSITSTTNQNLKPLYNTVLPISKKKFQNLQEMCHSKDAVIPKEFHAFYKALYFEKPLGSNNNSDDDSDDEICYVGNHEEIFSFAS
ncbi:unnamed protein product [Ceutorhynchus assimilis]|uniref:Uncharacterized protein n=1 Tax=Ceutorhynchus assimilis TaxID=467358 RepID=A0A9N9QIQ4_9CUCU|nr:unnamed protein product [Ceutorhynchus assimilis]